MFYGKFESKSDICHEFQIEESALAGCKILFAAYEADYEGTALVVFRKNRKLYEVQGAHCSCYGLEGQWEPEATAIEAFHHRLQFGGLRHLLNPYTEHFVAMLQGLSRKRKSSAS